MNIISKENYTFKLSKENKEVLRVKSGDTVIFETYDCMCGQIEDENKSIDKIDFGRVNPATGPIYVENAKVNQVLKVNIESIELVGDAVAVAGKDEGVLGGILDNLSANIIKIDNNKAIFKNIELPLNKMIGVIGVAPSEGAVNCGTPGSHGGNMDCKVIAEGSSVYFPIFTEGALLSMGDVHALMGDGEIGVSGAEIAAKIRVTIEIIEDIILKNPIVETEEAFYTIASASTLDEAQEIAVKNMFDIIYPKCNLNKNDLAMLLSLTADLEICQVVDPLKTVRFKIKKEILKKLNINSIY